MRRDDARRLLGHGALVVLVGMMVGFPYAAAVTGDGDVRAWRMAHLEGVLNGLLMMAVAASAPLMHLPQRASTAVRWLLIVTGYGNVLAATLGAISGQRGLQAAGPLANWLVFVGFTVAVLAVLAVLLIVVWGALRAEPGESTAAHGERRA